MASAIDMGFEIEFTSATSPSAFENLDTYLGIIYFFYSDQK